MRERKSNNTFNHSELMDTLITEITYVLRMKVNTTLMIRKKEGHLERKKMTAILVIGLSAIDR